MFDEIDYWAFVVHVMFFTIAFFICAFLLRRRLRVVLVVVLDIYGNEEDTILA